MANHPNRSSALARWADARSTSVEIARAIKAIVIVDETDTDPFAGMQTIWEAPSDDETERVLALAFADTDEDLLHWGVEKFSRPAA